MRQPARKDLRPILFLLLPLALALISCQAFYAAAGLLPTPSPTAQPTLTRQPALPTRTLPPAPAPTRTPGVPRATPPPTFPYQTQAASPTPLSLQLQRSLFQEIWETVRDQYLYPDYGGLDWEAERIKNLGLIEAGLSSEEFYTLVDEMIYALGDEHSFHLSPAEAAEEDTRYQGEVNYVGIGVLLTAIPERQRAVILCVFPGSPAEAAGLKTRDAILSAEGESILNEDGSLKTIIRGPEGTPVTLMAQTPGEEPRQVTLVRSAITSNQPVPYTLLNSPQGKRVGYILVVTLADQTVDDQFERALRDLSAEGPLDGLIIDNSQNEGGTDTVTKGILETLIQGRAGYFISREEERPLDIRRGIDIQGSQQMPLVVLVGPNTASFGEIFAGILQDLGRAYLIGETTDGNVETLWGYEFEDGSRLWLAHETFRPLNHPEYNWEQTGIIPDLEIPVRWDEFALQNDPLVLAALEYLDGLQP
jgi:C-terminal peptidase prc